MTVETVTLSSFLLARIAEDEQIASDAPGPRWHAAYERSGKPGHWRGIAAHLVTLDPPDRIDPLSLGEEVVRSDSNKPFAVDHINRHDPARVLAECEAKRRIVGDLIKCERMQQRGHVTDFAQGELMAYRAAAWLLCLPYADHPDYSEQWRP